MVIGEKTRWSGGCAQRCQEKRNGSQALSVAMDARRLTTEGASRPLSVPAGSYLDDEGMCFLPAFASGGRNWRSPSRPRGGAASTSQGDPRTIFRGALEHDNLVLAEVTAREIGRVTIAEALELTALVARKQPDRYGRFAARWRWRPSSLRSARSSSRCVRARQENSQRLCSSWRRGSTSTNQVT